MPSGLLRSCSSVVWGVAATVYTVSSARMRNGGAFNTPWRSRTVSVQSTCQVSAVCGRAEMISVLTVSLAARLSGLLSSVPFSHSLALAVAGSLAASIEYRR